MLRLVYILALSAHALGILKTSNEEFNQMLENIYKSYNATSVVSYIASAEEVALFGSAGYAQRNHHNPLFDRYGRVSIWYLCISFIYYSIF